MDEDHSQIIDLSGEDEDPVRLAGQGRAAMALLAMAAVIVAFVGISFWSHDNAALKAPTGASISPATTPGALPSALGDSIALGPVAPEPLGPQATALVAPPGWFFSLSLSDSTYGADTTGAFFPAAGSVAVHVICYGTAQIVVQFAPSDRGTVDPYPAQTTVFGCSPYGQESRVVFPAPDPYRHYREVAVSIVPSPTNPAADSWRVNLEMPQIADSTAPDSGANIRVTTQATSRRAATLPGVEDNDLIAHFFGVARDVCYLLGDGDTARAQEKLDLAYEMLAGERGPHRFHGDPAAGL